MSSPEKNHLGKEQSAELLRGAIRSPSSIASMTRSFFGT